MHRIVFAVLFCLILFPFSLGLAQAPDTRPEEQLVALIKEIQAQQAQIADNQAKIESKLAELAETIRVARVYSKREK